MVELVAEMAARRAGEVCAGEMIRRGYEPCLVAPQRGGKDVLIGMIVLEDTFSEAYDWRKGFVMRCGDDWELVDPDVLQRDFEEWKLRMRKFLVAGAPVDGEPVPSQLLQAVKRWGLKAVEAALAPAGVLA